MDSPALKDYTDLTNPGAVIRIDIDENTHIVCKAIAGSDLNAPQWQIYKETYTSDSNFSGYPYSRLKWAVNPATSLVENGFKLKAVDALTYSYI